MRFLPSREDALALAESTDEIESSVGDEYAEMYEQEMRERDKKVRAAINKWEMLPTYNYGTKRTHLPMASNASLIEDGGRVVVLGPPEAEDEEN